MNDSLNSWLLTDIGELCTLEELLTRTGSGHPTNVQMKDLSIQKNAWLAVVEGKVVGSGTDKIPGQFEDLDRYSAEGALVLPGFVDSHTHPVFAGSRTNEFLMRMNGATYQEIAAAGGGITASMQATRKASDEELVESTLTNLRTFLTHGVTTVEAKTGYGLSPKEELRHLRVLRKVRESTPQQLYVTCLALHAKSPEYPNFKAYADQCARELLPVVKKERLADAVDAFVEDGYFTVTDVRDFFSAAKAEGIAIRLHADEFTNSGGGLYAAELGAMSADHLQFVSDQALGAMAEKGVTATLLPGTSLYTKIPFTNGKRIIDAGVPLAIATDFNPGSCVIDNISLVATVASIHCGVPPAAALAGVTWVAARSLGLGAKKGALAPQFDADLTVWWHRTFADWIADFGRQKPKEVYIQGERLL